MPADRIHIPLFYLIELLFGYTDRAQAGLGIVLGPDRAERITEEAHCFLLSFALGLRLL